MSLTREAARAHYVDAANVLHALAELAHGPGSHQEGRRLTASRTTSRRWESRLARSGQVLVAGVGKTPELATEGLIRALERRLRRTGRREEASAIMAGRSWRALLRPSAVDRAARLARLGIYVCRRAAHRPRPGRAPRRRALRRRAPTRAGPSSEPAPAAAGGAS